MRGTAPSGISSRRLEWVACRWPAGALAAICLALSGLVPAAAAADSALPALSVQGSQLIDASGRTVRLIGVDRAGTEFKCIQGGSPTSRGWGVFDGPTDLASAQAIAAWHANTVRVPLNEDCWLGLNGVNPKWAGTAYQGFVRTYVQTLHQAGLYVILDLHWSAPGTAAALSQQPLPDADHSVDFWRSVAQAYAGDRAVLFDLHNEPFLYQSYIKSPTERPWDCWLRGCVLNQYLTGVGSPYTQTVDWTAAGMQTLIDTIRSAGSHNVILAGGLDWANDMSGWLTHRPRDPEGNLAASWHSYTKQGCAAEACWQAVIAPLAAKVPVIVGETGDSRCASPTFVPGFLSWADAHRLSYLGWAWNTWADCQNILIKDYAGTPTDNYGVYFRDHLLALPPLAQVEPRSLQSPAGSAGGAKPASPGAAQSHPATSLVSATVAMPLFAIVGLAALVAVSLSLLLGPRLIGRIKRRRSGPN